MYEKKISEIPSDISNTVTNIISSDQLTPSMELAAEIIKNIT